MNFNFNPILALTSPSCTLGAGAMILPTGNPAEFVISLGVLDTQGSAGTTGFDTVFKGGTTFLAEGRYTTHFFNLTGHQLLGAAYSDQLFLNLDQGLGNLIIPGLPVQQHYGSWASWYNFDQYLYQPDPKSDVGLGVFGRFGISDGQANPIHYVGSIGLGGKGLIPNARTTSSASASTVSVRRRREFPKRWVSVSRRASKPTTKSPSPPRSCSPLTFRFSSPASSTWKRHACWACGSP